MLRFDGGPRGVPLDQPYVSPRLLAAPRDVANSQRRVCAYVCEKKHVSQSAQSVQTHILNVKASNAETSNTSSASHRHGHWFALAHMSLELNRMNLILERTRLEQMSEEKSFGKGGY
jgi:hypothetical protein